MKQYFKNKSETEYYYTETISDYSEVSTIPRNVSFEQLIPVTEEEYANAVETQKVISEQLKQQANIDRIATKEAKEEALKGAYDELRKLGLSEVSARAVSGYHGAITE